MSEHPITPPQELVEKLRKDAPRDIRDAGVTRERHLVIAAYRAGADQELEACCEWCDDGSMVLAIELRAARRPKPPSLREQALEALEQIDGWAVANMNHLSIHDDLVTGVETIRRALERLQELENNG